MLSEPILTGNKKYVHPDDLTNEQKWLPACYLKNQSALKREAHKEMVPIDINKKRIKYSENCMVISFQHFLFHPDFPVYLPEQHLLVIMLLFSQAIQ